MMMFEWVHHVAYDIDSVGVYWSSFTTGSNKTVGFIPGSDTEATVASRVSEEGCRSESTNWIQ